MTERVSVDLNKPGGGVVWLTTVGTKKDLVRLGVRLTDGMRLDFWSDDADDYGHADNLHFAGVVRWDAERGIWTADIDQTTMMHASEEVE